MSTHLGEENNKVLDTLIKVAKSGNSSTVQQLLQLEAPRRPPTENDLAIALQRAAGAGNAETVKALLEVGAKVDGPKGKSALFVSIETQTKRSRLAIIRLFLQYGADVNARDHDGWTPMISAALRGQNDAVALLLERGANPDAVDHNSRNVLHLMATETRQIYRWNVKTLSIIIPKVTDLDYLDRWMRTPLSCAAAHGKLDLLGALIRGHGTKKACIGIANAKGQTPLHVAADNNHPGVTRFLVLQGADIEAKSDGDWTPLLNAAKKGHEEVIDALLSSKANVNAQTSSGMTSLHWAAENGHLKAVRRILQEPNVWTNAKDAFDSTPLIRAAQHDYMEIVEALRPHILEGLLSETAAQACNEFTAAVVDFYVESPSVVKNVVRKQSVYTAIYAKQSWDPNKFVVTTVIKDIKPRPPSFTWIHLPANNVAWAEALLTKHFLERSCRDIPGYKALIRLLGQQQHHGSEVHSRFMRPTCLRLWNGQRRANNFHTPAPKSKSAKPAQKGKPTAKAKQRVPSDTQVPKSTHVTPEDIIVLFMPYLHWETDLNRKAMTRTVKEALRRGRGSVARRPLSATLQPKDASLIHGYVNDSTNLHLRRTLDQFKHHSFDTEQQDTDQVVWRWCKDTRQELKIYMVDQLWVWVIGDLLITSFPERWGQPKRDPLNLFDGLVEDINSTVRPPIRNVYELATLVTERCSGAFDRHQRVNEEFSFLEMFELSIGALTRKETNIFQRFKDDSVIAAHWGRDRAGGMQNDTERWIQENESLESVRDEDEDDQSSAPADRVVARLLNIDQEAKLLAECRDIQEELGILSNVLEQQRLILRDLEEVFRRSLLVPHEERVELLGKVVQQQRQVDSQLADIDRMNRQAKSVNDNLGQVLDLKQKHANALEARFQRFQAQGTAKQSQTIMVFTVVTIIFLPMSFLASFFTLNIIEFPHDSNYGGNGLHLGWVVKYVIGIGLAVSIPLVGLAFVLGDIKEWLLRRRQRSAIKKQSKKMEMAESSISIEEKPRMSGVTQRSLAVQDLERGGIRLKSPQRDTRFLEP
ncbi:putative ankyrin repeat protein [Phaeomoniella chlamydospora]|uniref:Putative ankyrin repeat protein n=1 Tax=Phaeomoniella chlamydospora TaxID=158046 RepID=A0A0G2FNZ8_PHACM|nr:putative ankyrin repeat protein [Phaeomoniella chlamydospora]